MGSERPLPWSAKRRSKEALDRHIRAWADYLGLGSWVIRYSPDKPTEGAQADSQTFTPTGMAVIRIDATCPPALMDREIVHELLHVLLDRMTDTFSKGVSDRGSEAKAFLEGQWKNESEWVIERLVDALTEVPRQEYQVAGDSDSQAWLSGFPLT